MTSIERQMRAAMNEGLLEAFSEAVAHLGTNDLVLFVREAVGDEHAFSAVPRAIVADDPMAPQLLRDLIRLPAREVEPRAAPGDLTFWLVYLAGDGGSCCCAVNAKLIAELSSPMH
jgi:hypothetical protein